MLILYPRVANGVPVYPLQSQREQYDRWPHINTSFALLFLSKGRTPVLISKLVHGNWPRREDDTDWNNDRNDLRHLTEYLSRDDKLFGKTAVAWQTYDIMRASYASKEKSSKAEDDVVVARPGLRTGTNKDISIINDSSMRCT